MGLKKATVKLGADIGEFTSKMRKASSSFKKMGKNIQKAGKTMSMSLTAPLTAFAAASIKAFDTQAKSEAKLMTALKGNKKAFDNLTKSATAFQNVSTFGDEEIIAQQAYLASLGLTESEINKVISASMDLASGTGQTLEFGVKNLAKTFGGLTGELGESIPALKNLTKEQLMAGDAVDVVAEQFKGQAQAAAKAGAGGLKQLSNRFGDLMEKIGEMLIPLLNQLVSWVDQSITAWNNLDEGLKIAIVTLGGVLAAIGPMVTLFGTLVSVVGFFMSPLGAVIAGFAALSAAAIYVVDNFEAFKERFSDVGWWKNALIQMLQWFIEYNPYSLIIKGFNKVLDYFGKEPIGNVFENMSDGLEDLKVQTNDYKNEFGSFSDAISNAATKAKNSLLGLGSGLGIGTGGGLPSVSGGGSTSTGSSGGGPIATITAQVKELTIETQKFGLAMANDFANSFATAVTSGENFMVSMGNIFKDLAKQIAGMLIKAAMLAAVFSLIPSLGAAQAAAGGATGFSGILSGIMGGSFANGGKPPLGKVSLVGEAGPELFVPNSSGSIVPNDALGGSVIPDVRISGDDLLIVFDKANRRKARR